MKYIRRISSAILCLLLCALFVISASAESVSYTIDELGMTLSLPSEMVVTTKKSDSGKLGVNTYLEAKIPDDNFSITITMIQDENTTSIGEISSLSTSALTDFKERLEAAEAQENSLTEEIRSAQYNGNLYIDFSQKQYLENDLISYIRQSMTIKNGMGIYITSVSMGDDFTTEELSIIRACLSSVSFETIKSPSKTSFLTVLLWILAVILILVLAFFGFVLFMRAKNQKRRKALNEQRGSGKDYRAPRRSSSGGTVGGFKTSSDYFLEGFDREEEIPDNSEKKSSAAPRKNKEGVLKRTGYFFKNLSREIKKNNKRKSSKSSKKSPRPQSKDYDVFRDR